MKLKCLRNLVCLTTASLFSAFSVAESLGNLAQYPQAPLN